MTEDAINVIFLFRKACGDFVACGEKRNFAGTIEI
jgi:hypothetical protein